jgi:hypothetical protein
VIWIMRKKDRLKDNEEKLLNLTIYKPEEEIFQRLHLCEYLRELPEVGEDENRPPKREKKDFRRHLP